MPWRDAAAALDRATVRAFDYGDVFFQRILAGAPAGAPFALPAEYDGAFLSLSDEGVVGGTRKPSFIVHYGDFPGGILPKSGDRVIVATGAAAGTYEVDHLEENGDRTGAVLIVRKY
ncbi:MAG: hypothetical protein KIS73_24765 [Enhydrobacter sp.]|nr:hypothetical protein [Enhydrobacter sp.]